MSVDDLMFYHSISVEPVITIMFSQNAMVEHHWKRKFKCRKCRKTKVFASESKKLID